MKPRPLGSPGRIQRRKGSEAELAAERAARRAAERAAERLTRLLRITTALSEALTPEDVAEVVKDQGCAALEISQRVAMALERARRYEAAARAQAEAESANQAKDEFLTTVSHELRTPLAAILGWANILRSRPMAPEAVARALSVIERSARTQVQLIEDILDVSRMTTGKLRLEKRAVDPRALVRSVVEGARPAAEAQGVCLEAAIDDDVGPGAADPARLQQIASNLISNAIKFTSRGGRIAVRLERSPSGMRLQVTDSGKGIDATFLPHVFERFRQAEEGNARANGGLGLGLWIVKHLVELHEGTIRAESPGIGFGATFTVTLPLPPDAAVLDESAVGAVGARSGPLCLAGVRVLIVDDNDDARELCATILQEQGAITTLAASARDGFLAVQRELPDVLVSDIQMPEEDGHTLLRRVRAVAAVPALALTAHAGTQDAETAALAGFEMYLAKPVTPARLIETVAKLAGSGREAISSAEKAAPLARSRG